MSNNLNLGWKRCSKRMLLVTIVAATLVLTIGYYNRTLNPLPFMESRLMSSNDGEIEQITTDDRYAIRTRGCVIERMDPWDPSIKTYFKKLSTPECSRKPEDMLVELKEGYLKVKKDAKAKLMAANGKGKKKAPFVCQMKPIYRNQEEENDRKTFRFADNITEFKDWTVMDVEYAQVICKVGGVNVYKNFFFNTIRKSEVEEECEINSKQFLKEHSSCVDEPRLSVLLVGIDSLSKSNFLRQMPDTFDYLVNNMMAIDMLGYNKVGLNTFPSLIPYLTGNSTDELAKACWGGGGTNTFDNCTFLWDIFASAGYRTAFVENYDDYGLFVYNRGGIHRQIAHYYGHTLYIPVLKNSMKNGCWRGESDDGQVLNWALQFQKEFANDPHFGHFWLSRFAHDNLNTAQHLDPLISKLFKQMNVDGLLNNTILLFMSDHGIRFGKFRETEVGRQEENLPFMYLIFPRWFKERHSAALDVLRSNRHKLITAFDLHETLKAIINCNFSSSSGADDAENNPRGVSLFQPISGNRTCDDAGIPAIYCACRENVVEMARDSEEANKLAQLLVDQLNVYTEQVRNICVKFFLKEILSLKQIVQAGDPPKSKPIPIKNTHIISILVKPGDAKFEATIQLITSNSTYIVNNDVRRINRYGDTSWCISNDGFLKSVCFCGHN
ncbi:hypothetical protein CHUAL_007644 [Chamberlinius hualienensis]